MKLLRFLPLALLAVGALVHTAPVPNSSPPQVQSPTHDDAQYIANKINSNLARAQWHNEDAAAAQKLQASTKNVGKVWDYHAKFVTGSIEADRHRAKANVWDHVGTHRLLYPDEPPEPWKEIDRRARMNGNMVALTRWKAAGQAFVTEPEWVHSTVLARKSKGVEQPPAGEALPDHAPFVVLAAGHVLDLSHQLRLDTRPDRLSSTVAHTTKLVPIQEDEKGEKEAEKKEKEEKEKEKEHENHILDEGV